LKDDGLKYNIKKIYMTNHLLLSSDTKKGLYIHRILVADVTNFFVFVFIGRKEPPAVFSIIGT